MLHTRKPLLTVTLSGQRTGHSDTITVQDRYFGGRGENLDSSLSVSQYERHDCLASDVGRDATLS